MSSSTAARPTSPIAARIRARLAEMGMAESAASRALGWDRTVLSTILRRLDAGSNITTETLTALEKLLGKPAQWILTGEEPAGVRLSECDGWAEAARVARERYGISEEKIAHVGQARVPSPLRFVEPALIRAIADAL